MYSSSHTATTDHSGVGVDGSDGGGVYVCGGRREHYLFKGNLHRPVSTIVGQTTVVFTPGLPSFLISSPRASVIP